MNRGIVIGSRVNIEKGFSFNGTVESTDLVKWLLYWDQITYAGFGFGGGSITGNHSHDVQFLEAEGIFKTEIVDLGELSIEELPEPELGINMMGFSGNQIPYVSAAARVKLANQLSSTTGDVWTMGQSGGELLLLPGVRQQKELIDVQLINCMPVPVGETAFEDILSFKQKYHSELERLRYATDAFRERILSSVDERRAIDAAIHEISLSLADIHKALNGNGVNTLSETISLYTNNPALGFWTSLGGVVAAGTGIPLEVGAAAGLGLPTVCKFLKRAVSGGQNLPNPNKDFTYAYEVIRQFK
jgi:hypothetical protein